MVSAIGASPLPAAALSAAKQTVSDPELARYKKEYAACVDCESAKTNAGKRNIQMLDNKIKEIEAHTNKVPAATPTSPPAALAANTAGKLDVYA